MDWRKAEKQADDYKSTTYTIPNRWLNMHYYEALNILFRVENALRVFVYIVLKNTFFEKWHDIQIEVSEGQTTSISAASKKRISQARDFGYLGYEISSPLMNLNSGELVRLITSDEYWKYFAKYFKGRKEIIRNKLDEIGSIRNALAHFRPIKEDDVELVKQTAKHVLIAVEASLAEITSLHTAVPTNTTDVWYKKIATLGNKSCSISMFQSQTEDWIRIQIVFKSTTINISRFSEDWLSYQILNLKTPNICTQHQDLINYVTYISENIPYLTMPNDLKPDFSKIVSLVFSKQVIADKLNLILSNLESLLNNIASEEELVASDSLARGKLIESITVSARLIKEEKRVRWELWTYSMQHPFKEEHPAEYWGNLGLYQSDFIAGTTKYPWMPSDISRFDI